MSLVLSAAFLSTSYTLFLYNIYVYPYHVYYLIYIRQAYVQAYLYN